MQFQKRYNCTEDDLCTGTRVSKIVTTALNLISVKDALELDRTREQSPFDCVASWKEHKTRMVRSKGLDRPC